jgi:hypothetical protein
MSVTSATEVNHQFSASPLIDESKKEVPSPAVENNVALTEEGIKALIAKEAEYKALAANLFLFLREQDLNRGLSQIKDPVMRLVCLSNLLEVKIELYKRAGGSVAELVKEYQMDKPSEPGQEICQLYTTLLEEAQKITKPDKYCAPFLRLYELEQRSGLVINGKTLLIHQAEKLAEIKSKMWNALCDENYYIRIGELSNFQSFILQICIPTLQQLLKYAENEKDPIVMRRLLDRYMDTPLKYEQFRKILYSWILSLDERFFFYINRWDAPFNFIFPYLVKYGSLNEAKDYFNSRWTCSWERAYKWVDLCCQAAEINPEKAKEYVSLAEKEVKQQLMPYLFSWNRKAILQKQKEANERIAAAKLKVAC